MARFDIYARAVARHLGRHIPGNPTVVVKNMPGAGSAKAGVHISTVAPKDGLSIGAVTPGAIVGPLLDDKPQSMFDPAKVTYLGTANSGTRICVTYDKSKVRSFKQAMTEKMVLGGVVPATRCNISPSWSAPPPAQPSAWSPATRGRST